MSRYISISYSSEKKADGFSRQSFTEKDRSDAIQFLASAVVDDGSASSHDPDVRDSAKGQEISEVQDKAADKPEDKSLEDKPKTWR